MRHPPGKYDPLLQAGSTHLFLEVCLLRATPYQQDAQIRMAHHHAARGFEQEIKAFVAIEGTGETDYGLAVQPQ